METKKSYVSSKDIIINTPVPQETRTYKPISHEQLISLTVDSIMNSGFEIGEERYTAAKNGNFAMGRYTIKNVKDSEMSLEVGWQNSYDKSVSLKFAIGTRIVVCSNGCVAGDFGAFKKKHQGTVKEFTPSAIVEYIKRAGDVFQRIQRERDAMKNIEVTKRTASELIGRMFIEEGIIQSTQMNIIKREMEAPSFDYGCANSMWELYNHTTLALKEVHPTLWLDSHMDVHNFFARNSGIVVPASVELEIA